MYIVAIDTSTYRESIAVLADGVVVAHYADEDRNTHSERIYGAMDSLLRDVGIELKDVRALAFANGPGSFTGLRIGLSMLKGLSLSLSVPIIPVNTLEALSRKVGRQDCTVVPVMDARRGEVYGAAFRNRARLIDDCCVVADVLAEKIASQESCLFIGDGYEPYREIFNAFGDEVPGRDFFIASQVALIAYERMQKNDDFLSTEATLNYIRPSDAEQNS